MTDFKDEIRVFREEAERDRMLINKKWIDFVNKMGTMVEDIVAPNIKGIARKYFGCEKIYDFSVRRFKTKVSDTSQGREFDIIAVCEDKVILNETKSKPNISDIYNFVALLGEFYDYFPDYKDKVLIPTFASLYLNDDMVKYLTRNKIYAMSIKDDTMEILNPVF